MLVRIQDLDSTVSTLATQNASLQTSLTQAETRMAEFYADQARAEEELGMRHELAEKLRSQLREVEKEKRELTRRYNEQVRLNTRYHILTHKSPLLIDCSLRSRTRVFLR